MNTLLEWAEPEELTMEDRTIVDAKIFSELYGAENLQVMVEEGMCPECGEEVGLSMGDHTIMVKAECPNCEFGFVDTQRAVDYIIDN